MHSVGLGPAEEYPEDQEVAHCRPQSQLPENHLLEREGISSSACICTCGGPAMSLTFQVPRERSWPMPISSILTHLGPGGPHPHLPGSIRKHEGDLNHARRGHEHSVADGK